MLLTSGLPEGDEIFIHLTLTFCSVRPLPGAGSRGWVSLLHAPELWCRGCDTSGRLPQDLASVLGLFRKKTSQIPPLQDTASKHAISCVKHSENPLLVVVAGGCGQPVSWARAVVLGQGQEAARARLRAASGAGREGKGQAGRDRLGHLGSPESEGLLAVLPPHCGFAPWFLT